MYQGLYENSIFIIAVINMVDILSRIYKHSKVFIASLSFAE